MIIVIETVVKSLSPLEIIALQALQAVVIVIATVILKGIGANTLLVPEQSFLQVKAALNLVPLVKVIFAFIIVLQLECRERKRDVRPRKCGQRIADFHVQK